MKRRAIISSPFSISYIVDILYRMKHSKSIDITLAATVIILGVVGLLFLRGYNINTNPSKPSSIGTIVEVYNKEDSYFAIPAIITDEIISISTSPSSR